MSEPITPLISPSRLICSELITQGSFVLRASFVMGFASALNTGFSAIIF